MYYTVYILYSEAHERIYVGFTSNLLERLKSHNFFATKGWTIKFRPWTVIYCEYFESKQEAMQRERDLKTARLRSWIHSKIEKEYRSKGFISA